MKIRKPKDPSKFIHPVVAATRLIQIATESILWSRYGTRVHWELKVRFYQDENFKPGKRQRAVSQGFTASSGTLSPHIEAIITGHGSTEPPIEAGTCRYCGCTEYAACEGGCSWIDDEQTVCSACEEKHAHAMEGQQ